MSSSVELAPSTHPLPTQTATSSLRKRSREASFGQAAHADDLFGTRASKHARTQPPVHQTALRASQGISVTRWPELYVDDIASSIRHDRALAEAQLLHPANISGFVRGQGNRIGVVLGLHGLSAGPWQFIDLATAYAQLGFDVYTPRMLGHGLRKDGRPNLEAMPGIEDEKVYGRHAQVVFDNARTYAQSQNLPLLFVAHSAGAVLAATLVQDHPNDVAGQVYINPLQAPTAWSARLKFLLARLIYRTSWGHRWLERSHHVFVQNADGDSWPGYPSLPLSKIFPMLNRARNVWRSFVSTAVPTMLFVSEYDQTCDPVPTLRSAKGFFKNLTVHLFKRREKVVHAMVSAIENPRADIRQRIYDASGSFLAKHARSAGRPSGRSTENT